MVGSDIPLANFNHHLNMHFKYHPESAKSSFPLKETRSPTGSLTQSHGTWIKQGLSKISIIKDPFLPTDLTCWDILRRSHFKGSSQVAY
jgi:hypothetical protein